MREFNILLVFLMLVFGCNGQETKYREENKTSLMKEYVIFGGEIDPINVLSDREMATKFKGMGITDTLETKFKATVADVCQVKGCWMKLELENGQETMVRFKDYGFFVPKDIIGQEVIVNGLAFVEAMSVEDQKHYARDGGQSESEISKITKPLKTFGFEADGVLLPKD